MAPKKGDVVELEWGTFRVTGFGSSTIKGVWESGVLKGREANIAREHFKPKGKK